MQEAILLLRMVLGALFLTAGFSKIRSLPDLKIAIQRYSMSFIKPELALLLAWLLPPVEIIMGGFFIVGLWLRFVSLFAVITLILFTVLISINLYRGYHFKCNCFGTISSGIGPGSLIRNVLLLSACLFLAVTTSWFSSFSAFLFVLQGFTIVNLIAFFIAGISLYVLLIAIDEINFFFHPSRI